MKDKLKAYKEKLEQGIAEYMMNPVSERSASAVKGMVECWAAIDEMEHCVCHSTKLTQSEAEKWVTHMANDDGTMGEHWTMDQTTAVADGIGIAFDHISPWCWWVTMNMMYSDYCAVADKYGVGTVEFYADLAKAFLFDKDASGAKEKLAAYYYGIVDNE